MCIAIHNIITQQNNHTFPGQTHTGSQKAGFDRDARVVMYGPNALYVPVHPLWWTLLVELTHPFYVFQVGVWVCFCVCVGGGGMVVVGMGRWGCTLGICLVYAYSVWYMSITHMHAWQDTYANKTHNMIQPPTHL